MGKRGPKRLPLDVLIARGSTHARGRTQDIPEVPAAERKMPTKPLWLSQAASAFWDTSIPKLLPLGLLGAADDDTIGRYCQAFVDWVILGNHLRRDGHTITTEKGYLRNPDAVSHDGLSKVLAHLEEVLGLTPAARLKMHLNILPLKAPSTAKTGTLDRGKPELGGEEFFRRQA